MGGVPRRHLDDQYAAFSRCRREGHPINAEVQRRFDAVRTDLRDVVRQCVQLFRFERLRLAIVGYPQYETAAIRVGERRHLIGEPVATRRRDPAAAKLNLLQFESAVFTETNLFP